MSELAKIDYRGRVIEAIIIVDDELRLDLSGDLNVSIYDDGQSCCESRYMRTDDDLQAFVGARILGAEVRDVPDLPEGEWDDVHEVQFLIVDTTAGSFTIASHNEHNGYYGGFDLAAKVRP